MMDVYIEIKSNPAAEKQTNSLLMLKFNPGDFIFRLVLKSLAPSASVREKHSTQNSISGFSTTSTLCGSSFEIPQFAP